MKQVSFLKEVFRHLTRTERRKYSLVVIIQALLGFLDLFGVAIIGAIGAISIRGVNSQPTNSSIQRLLSLIGLADDSLQTQVIILSLVATALLITKTVLSMIVTKKIFIFLARVTTRISGILTHKVFNQDLAQLQTLSIQRIQFSVSTGVSALITGILGNITILISDFVLLFIIFLGLLLVDPLSAIFIVAMFLLVGLLLKRLTHKQSRELGLQMSDLAVGTDALLQELNNSYRELFVKNRRQHYISKVIDSRSEYNVAFANQTFLPNVSKYVVEISIILGALLISGIQFALNDASHAIAGLAVFLAAGSRLAPSLLRIQQSWLQIQSSIGTSEMTRVLMAGLVRNQPEAEATSDLDNSALEFQPSVEIKSLKFTYPGQSAPTIKNLSLDIPIGAFVAIVGPSGSGKSTFIDLLLGINKPDSGKIRISGLEPRQAIRKWPGSIGYIPQDVAIIKGTLAQNVMLGYPAEELNTKLLRESLKVADLVDYWENLRQGFDSPVGEEGLRVSGGQKQRIGIARALYGSPRLIVMDEATSALDATTEERVTKSLKTFSGNSTLIVIAHRLSTVKDADLIYYLSEGEIKAFGNFSELMKKVPSFRQQATLMGLQ